MQCRDVQMTLSAMADHEVVDIAELARVRDHCKRCSECAAFAFALAHMRRARPPRVPRGLAGRIAARVRQEADADEALLAEQTLDATAAGMLAPATPPSAETTAEDVADSPAPRGLSIPWLSRERLWTVIAAVGTSAAVALLGVAVSAQLAGRAAIDQETEDAIARSLSLGVQGQTAQPSPGENAAAPAAASPAKAPPFVAFDRKVYAPSASADEVDPSRLTTVGAVNTALAGGGAPTPLDAFTRQGDISLIIRRPDGTFQVCAPVVRSFGDGTYQLVTGVDLPSYGAWPRLPTDIPEPTNASGAPAFISAGTDSLGVRIYARIGFDTSRGIAVAPGTASSDPAGGNPYWTWWARLP